MKKKNITFVYGIIQCIYWSAFAVLGGFASVFLLAEGLSNSAIGFVLSGGALVAALLQPVVGALIDKTKKITNKLVLIVVSIVTAGLCIAMYVTPQGAWLAIGMYFGFCYVMMQLSQPFMNAVAMEYVNHGYEVSFGPARAAGSFGYALVAYIVGILTERFGTRVIAILGIFGFIAIAISLVLLLPNLKSINETELEQQSKASTKIRPQDFIKKYPRYMVMLVGFVCIYYTHNLVNVYLPQIIEVKGGSSADVGAAVAIAAASEIVTMSTFPWIAKRIKLSTIVKGSTVFFTLKILLALLVPNVAGLMFAQALQFGGWGIVSVALVLYVNSITQVEDMSQGQAYAGVSLTLGTVLATLTGGYLLDIVGVNVTLLIGTIIGIIGMVIVFCSCKAEK